MCYLLRMWIKDKVRALPGGAALLNRIRNIRAEKIDSSGDYWEERYRNGGHSGAGSYGRLARFKAEFLNDFVKSNDIKSVIEFGSGDGAQLTLADYPRYTGVDVSHSALAKTRDMFKNRADITFVHASEYRPGTKAELALSLDVIYHLVEDEAYDGYMQELFDAATRYVIIYSSNDARGFVSPHVRHRKFDSWVTKHRPDFRLMAHKPNPYPEDPADAENTSFADFYVFAKA